MKDSRKFPKPKNIAYVLNRDGFVHNIIRKEGVKVVYCSNGKGLLSSFVILSLLGALGLHEIGE